MEINLVPINLNVSAPLCIQFRLDSFVSSFGNADLFYEKCGTDGSLYIQWLRKISNENPLSALHVWEGNQIIGQLELTIRKDEKDQEYGYVNLFYLIPEKRGIGIGNFLNDYVDNYYRNRGISKILLTVGLKNTRSIKYYQKHGWKEVGLRKDFPGTQYMEKLLNNVKNVTFSGSE